MTRSTPPGRALDYARIFEALPSPYLILTADFTIVTANRAYASATMIDPQAVAGQPMFEVFPDNPDDPHADGVRNLRRSLQAVVDTGRPDSLALQRYDIRTPDGRFVERYWSPVNTPVLADDGSVAFIVHRVQDVTDLVELRRAAREHQHAAAVLRTQVEQMEADLFSRGRELQDANLELQRVNGELAAAVPNCAPSSTPRTSSSPSSPTSCATRSPPCALPWMSSAWMCQTIRLGLSSTGN